MASTTVWYISYFQVLLERQPRFWKEARLNSCAAMKTPLPAKSQVRGSPRGKADLQSDGEFRGTLCPPFWLTAIPLGCWDRFLKTAAWESPEHPDLPLCRCADYPVVDAWGL